MNDFPEAKAFYVKRSQQRRIEFKRLMRNFYEKLERKNLLAIFEEDGSTIQSNLTLKEGSNPDNQDNHDHHGESGAEEHDIDPHYLLLDKETER